MFKLVESKISFPEMEMKIIDFWQKHDTFEKSLEWRKDCPEYVFYDGPPFATGLPHYGHILPGTMKDIIPRYQTMKGKYVYRRFGWDCHGLPVEKKKKKDLELNTKKDIESYGIDKFNEACRSIVLRYTNEWEKTVIRMGRWIYFKNAYKTMDMSYMESIWWVFHSLWEKGLIYEGHKILPYCPRCATPLSNFEANQGYMEVQDPAITIKFKLKTEENTFILAWTTTPWTLPSNLALAVGPEIDYVKVKDRNENYILAETILPSYYKNESDYEIIARYKGSDLKNKHYEPLFSYFQELEKEGAFKIITADFVSTEEGTGIVHTAPGFGEDDALAGKANGIPSVCPIDDEGAFTEDVFDYTGVFVKEADKQIIKRLKNENKCVKHSTYVHNYPHCWRCDSPLLYRAVSSWFVNIQKIKKSILASNDRINWIPAHIKHGRFGKWLEGAIDWAISRNRYWGSPIPVWKCECGEVKCIGSISELEKKINKKITDIHKHIVDDYTFPCEKCRKPMQRIPEVLDCWFESGSMPYAQNHYPFENKQHFENTFPCDFISESLDQTRGWFYTLVVLSSALFQKPAFANVIVTGMVLAEDGKKMSKRLKNYPEVDYIFDHYGADALRIYLMNSALVKADDLNFSENGVKEILRIINLPLWNAYSFLVSYAVIDKWDPAENKLNQSGNSLDKWILSLTEKLVNEVTESMDNYEIQNAIRSFTQFLDQLTNWYIRRSRRRFWKSENDSDKLEAYSTLYNVLLTFVKITAPFIPFITEEIYQNLRTDIMPESVHLCDYPVYRKQIRDFSLEKEMEIVQKTVTMGRSLRTKHKIKVKQPLQEIFLVTKNREEQEILKKLEGIIKEELNIKNVMIKENETELVELSASPNFRVLGKKLGKNMKDAKKLIEAFSNTDITRLENAETITIKGSSFQEDISLEDIVIKRTEKSGLSVLNQDTLTVALNTELTEGLVNEGISREIIRVIQNLRKDNDFDISDRIKVFYQGSDKIDKVFSGFSDYIKQEVLATEIINDCSDGIEEKIQDEKILIRVEKV